MITQRHSSTVTAARRAITLVELLVVLAILAGTIGLLLPAVQQARESGRSAVCANNLRQLGIAARSHWELTETFPVPNESWTVTLLPWLEERHLAEEIKSGNRNVAIGNRPVVFNCPSQPDPAVNDTGVLTCHYTLRLGVEKKGGLVRWHSILDRSQNFTTKEIEPWYIGPMDRTNVVEPGPHTGGRYNSS